jgi:predicted nucleic acid-binding protein
MERRRIRGEQHPRLEDLSGDLISIGVDEQFARRAGELAEGLGLRGYDAVHLTTALELSDEGVALVTWDADLQRGAEKVGLAVAGG